MLPPSLLIVFLMVMIIVIYCNQFIFHLNTCRLAQPVQSCKAALEVFLICEDFWGLKGWKKLCLQHFCRKCRKNCNICVLRIQFWVKSALEDSPQLVPVWTVFSEHVCHPPPEHKDRVHWGADALHNHHDDDGANLDDDCHDDDYFCGCWWRAHSTSISEVCKTRRLKNRENLVSAHHFNHDWWWW